MKSPVKRFRLAINSVARFGAELVRRQEGQMAPMIMTAMLIGYTMCMGAAIDMSNLWLHKYRVMTAANAACMAGTADLAWVAKKGTASAITNYQSSSTGFQLAIATGSNSYIEPPANSSVSGQCSSNSKNAICAYAGANGYSPSRTGVIVTWSVSNKVPTPPKINVNGYAGVAAFSYPPNTGAVPATSNGVLPYLHVTVTEQVPTYLLSLMPWFHSPVTVSAGCDCGLEGSPSPEQSISAVCPFNEFAYDSGAWQSVSAGQIRTTGNNFGYGESANYVFFNCDDTWIDQAGNNHPWNYLSTLSNVTVDDVAMRQSVGNQESGAGSGVISSVVLVSSSTPFTPKPCSSDGGYSWTGQPGIPGVIDWAPTDYFIQSVNKTAPYFYESDTNSAYSPWSTQPPHWNEPLLPSGYTWISNPTTGIQYAEPSDWFVGTGTGSETYWSAGADSPAIVNALSTNRYFGFGWCFQGNGNRDFIGNGTNGSMTIYFHQGGSSVSSFGSY